MSQTKEYRDKYYAENKEKIKANVKRHRQNPEYRKKQNVWNKKWQDSNKEKVLLYRRKSQKKRVEILKEIGAVNEKIREKILLRDDNKCLSCGSKTKLTIDHIIPITKGGLTRVSNLQTLCMVCNAKKQTCIIDYRKNKTAIIKSSIIS